MSADAESWAPQACTLPTTERPLRVAEFDELFAHAVRGVRRQDPATLSLDLVAQSDIAARAADFVVRETACCSFFTFGLIAIGGSLRLDVTVPAAHVDVLDALAARAGRPSS